ncbi:Hypothetical predicted protein [Octopus vulgaris]|uniref:Uncharacterized protein n=1 Tax=Octopus vulgaris TaxID=6645 RepID=A0AA36AF67_OCTVU|nr:Hypothetical predicted protein [Octopus vulgaris]
MVARLVKYKTRRIGQITRFEDSRFLTQLIYGELALGKLHQCKLKRISFRKASPMQAEKESSSYHKKQT